MVHNPVIQQILNVLGRLVGEGGLNLQLGARCRPFNIILAEAKPDFYSQVTVGEIACWVAPWGPFAVFLPKVFMGGQVQSGLDPVGPGDCFSSSG
jgi:hypothetical protein